MWGLLLHEGFISINEVFLFVVQDTWFWPCTMHGFCSFEHPERSLRQWQISLQVKGLCGSHFCTSFTYRRFFSRLPQPSLQIFKRCEALQSCSLPSFSSVKVTSGVGVSLTISFWNIWGHRSKVEVLKGSLLHTVASTKRVGELHVLSESQSCRDGNQKVLVLSFGPIHLSSLRYYCTSF